MHIRIVTARTVIGKVYVTCVKCHKCGHDTWEWEQSMSALPGFHEVVGTLGVAFCHECNEKLLFEEEAFLLEGVNERAGWFAKRHAK